MPSDIDIYPGLDSPTRRKTVNVFLFVVERGQGQGFVRILEIVDGRLTATGKAVSHRRPMRRAGNRKTRQRQRSRLLGIIEIQAVRFVVFCGQLRARLPLCVDANGVDPRCKRLIMLQAFTGGRCAQTHKPRFMEFFQAVTDAPACQSATVMSKRAVAGPVPVNRFSAI